MRLTPSPAPCTRKHTMFLVALFVLVFAGALFAQNTGELQGFVKDAQGNPLSDVQVTVSGPNMIRTENATTDERGFFSVPRIPPGKYNVEFSLVGYQNVKYSEVYIRVGTTRSLNPKMTEADVSEQVITISADAPIIDVTNSGRSLNIDGDFIQRMPLTYDREWDNAWALVPGTVNEGQYGPYGNRVEVHGGSIFQNVWNLEGMNVGSTFTNANNIYFAPDIIEEVHVVTTGFDASIPSAQGGYINVVTKSGGNDFSGSVALYYQPTNWNWSNVEGGDAPEQAILQPSFTLGGPIMRDRAWFFANYRYASREEAYGRTADDLAYFDQFDLPRPTQKRETTSHQFFGKATYQISDNWKAIGTFNTDEGSEDHADMPTNGTDDSGIEIEEGGQFYSGKIEGAIGDRLSVSAAASFYTANNVTFGNGGFDTPSITRYSSTYIDSSGNIRGTGNVAYYNNRRGAGWGNDSENERFEFRADGRYFLDNFYGSHEFSFGFNGVPYQKAYSDSVYSTPYRVYEAKNDAGQWVPFYQQVYTDPRFTTWDFQIDNYAGYVQDSWVVSDRLSVNAGVRIENQRDGVELDITEFSPNIGFNYALSSGYTDSIRASYGIRHHLLAGRDGDSSKGRGSSAYVEYWDNDLNGDWDVVQESGTSLSSSGISPTAWSDDIGMPYAHELQIGYARLLPYKLKLDLAYIYKINKNSLYGFDRNVIYQNGQFVGLANEELSSDTLYINDELSSRHYQSYEVSLTKEFSDGWQLMGSYTYQSSLLKGEWQPDDPLRYMHPESWFESPDDYLRPHVFRLAAYTILPWDITFSTNVTFQSGQVDAAKFMNAGTGVDVDRFFTLSNGDTITHPFWTVRPYYRARDVGREVTMDNLWIFNVGAGKNFDIAGYRFETQVQVFNLFNTDSYTSQSFYNALVNEDGSQARDLSYSWIQPPRAVQWTIKYSF